MGGHEGNTESIPKRCVFLITLFTTFYGIVVLNENWPKTPLEPSAAVEMLNAKPSNLQELLLSMDSFYNVEINAEHHDHDEHLPGHGDDHGDEHEEDEGHEDSHESHTAPHAAHGATKSHQGGKSHDDHIVTTDQVSQLADDIVDMMLDPDMELTDSELEDQARLYEEYLRDEASNESDAQRM